MVQLLIWQSGNRQEYYALTEYAEELLAMGIFINLFLKFPGSLFIGTLEEVWL